MQLPTRCLVCWFLHRPRGSGYLITCVSDVVTVQKSQCRGLENSDYVVVTVQSLCLVGDWWIEFCCVPSPVDHMNLTTFYPSKWQHQILLDARVDIYIYIYIYRWWDGSQSRVWVYLDPTSKKRGLNEKEESKFKQRCHCKFSKVVH